MHIVDVCAFYTPHGGGVRTYVERKLAFAETSGDDVTIIVPGTRAHIERRSRRTRWFSSNALQRVTWRAGS